MERLTTYNERFGKYQIDGDGGNVMIDGFYHIIGNAVDRLAEYENTGLTPEEIKEDTPNIRLIEEKLAAYEDAEEDGRLIILPVKPGDFVYTLNYPRGGNFLMIFQHCVKDLQEIITWTLHGAFGKTVFLAREEAEAALAAMEGREDG